MARSALPRTTPNGPTDLSREDYTAARKLIEELKRLYGRMSECLDDVERRTEAYEQIEIKQRQIAELIPMDRAGLESRHRA